MTQTFARGDDHVITVLSLLTSRWLLTCTSGWTNIYIGYWAYAKQSFV